MGATKAMYMREHEQNEQPAKPRSMFNIRQDHLSLLAEIEEADGELTVEMHAALTLTQQDFKDKAISYGFVVRKLEAEAEVIAAEISRLSARKKKLDNRSELFKGILDAGMKEFGYEKIESPLMTLSYRKSNPVHLAEDFSDNILRFVDVTVKIKEDLVEAAAEVGITAETLSVFDVIPSPSKTRIGAEIKQGVTIPGASMPEKKNLQIK